MDSVASLPSAWPPAQLPGEGDHDHDNDNDIRSVETAHRRVTLWGSEYDLSTNASQGTKGSSWRRSINIRIGKTLRSMKKHLIGAKLFLPNRIKTPRTLDQP